MYQDNFNRDNSDSLGSPWVASQYNGTNTFRVINNQLCMFRWIGIDRFNQSISDDHWAELTFVSCNNQNTGPAVRMSGTWDHAYFYMAAVQNSNVYLYKAVDQDLSSSLGTLLASQAVTMNSGDKVRIRAYGDVIKVFVNGSEIISVTDGGISSGQAGIVSYGNSVNEAYWDDFKAGDVEIPVALSEELGLTDEWTLTNLTSSLSESPGISDDWTLTNLTGGLSEEPGIQDEWTLTNLTGGLSEEPGFQDEWTLNGIFNPPALSEDLGILDDWTITREVPGDLSEQPGLQDEFHIERTMNPPALSEDMGFSDEWAVINEITRGLSEQPGITDSFSANLEITRGLSEEVGFQDVWGFLNFTWFMKYVAPYCVRRFFFILTGAEDGLQDVTIPISSFQSRIRPGDPTYLSVVIPTMAYAKQISDRSNGQMVIIMAYVRAGTTLLSEEIVRANLEDITPYEGPVNKSVTLVGHKSKTWTTKTVTLRDVTYRSVSGGKPRYRGAVDLYLRPGDTVICGDDLFTAGEISLTVGVQQQTMEVEAYVDTAGIQDEQGLYILDESGLPLLEN